MLPGHESRTLSALVDFISGTIRLRAPQTHSDVIHSDTTHRRRYHQSSTQGAHMTQSEYQVEKTAIGMQYVIPDAVRHPWYGAHREAKSASVQN